MSKITRVLAVFLVLTGAVSVSAQTAADIVAKNLAADGGKEAIGKVKSLSMEMTANMMGNELPSTLTVLDGVASRTEMVLNGSKIVQCYTDKSGWFINPAAGVNDPQPIPDEQYLRGKSQIYVGGDLYDYEAKGSKIELTGKDDKTYTVKLTTKDNVETTYVFDATTYLVKSIVFTGKLQDQDVVMTTSFSDYRKTPAGLLMPYAISVDFGGQYSMNMTITKIEENTTVDPALCAKPKSSPPVAAKQGQS